MASRRGVLTGSAAFAFFSHFYIFGVANLPGPVPVAATVGLIVGWIGGFLLGWVVQPKFVSRQTRYKNSAYTQFLDRIVMGIAWGGGFGMLMSVAFHGMTQ